MIAYRSDYDTQLPKGFHLGTYRANPVALAAGTAILNYLKNTDILERVSSKGQYIMKRLNEIQDSSRYIGEVRGKGFMIGAELVKGRKTKEPSQEMANMVKSYLYRHGVLMLTCGHFGNVMRYIAPLTIEDELIDKGLSIFEDAVKELEHIY
jgi:4-aminobutyrate aminotransferase-like enzyme